LFEGDLIKLLNYGDEIIPIAFFKSDIAGLSKSAF
jgi:hypothetical protein